MDSDQQEQHNIRFREHRRALLVIVWIALFVDNMLLTTVVPIVPQYLLGLSDEKSHIDKVQIETSHQHPNKTSFSSSTLSPVSNNSFELQQDQAKKQQRHELFANENVLVGIIFGSKAVAQLVSNPLIGSMTNRIGYTVPMFMGFVILFGATLLFAFGSAFWELLAGRFCQGVGSAFTSTAGFGMLATAYPDDEERGKIMGIAMGGLGLGLMFGAPYGGMLYHWSGGSKALPFVLLAIVALLDGALQLAVLRPSIERRQQSVKEEKIERLLRDPYILIAAFALTVGNLGWGSLESTLNLWMMENLNAGSLEVGYSYFAAAFATNCSGALSFKIGRWLYTLISFVMLAVCYVAIPFATNIFWLIALLICGGFAGGMVDASMLPVMGLIVDIRHAETRLYGCTYAIGDAAICLAFALGGFGAAPLARAFGFKRMMHVIAALTLIYAPLLLFLRNISPAKAKVADGMKTAAGNDNNNKNDSVVSDASPAISEMHAL